MVNDLISDMLTRIRNAVKAQHLYTLVPYSKVNLALLAVLFEENYIKDYIVEKTNKKNNQIKVYFFYKGFWIKKSYFSVIKRISKPGRRIFLSYKNFKKEIPLLKYNQGIAIVSTSLGVISHNKAVELKKGGEILCYIE